MKTPAASILRPPRVHRGAALIISLVLLVLITILGIASLRGVVLEEKMASNYYDRSLAFQAAESALRVGESVALAASQEVPPHQAALALTPATSVAECSSVCSSGMCPPPGDICPDRWNLPNPPWVSATSVNLTDQAGTAPQYFIEFLGNNFPCDPSDASSPTGCARYRITARSQPGDGRAEVILQSVYATQ